MQSTASSVATNPTPPTFRSPGASVDAAVASAARDVMLALTRNQRQRIEQEYAAALAEVRDGPAKDQGALLGRQAASVNLDRRAGDGILPSQWPPQQGPITEPVYAPTSEPGNYDFTPPFDAPPLGPLALFPGWGRLTPFVIDLSHHRLKSPDPLRSKRYASDLNYLKAYGRLRDSRRTADQTNTAFFWFEEFAIWNDIAATVVQKGTGRPVARGSRSGGLAVHDLANHVHEALLSNRRSPVELHVLRHRHDAAEVFVRHEKVARVVRLTLRVDTDRAQGRRL
jgi:hypothetical protein